jgi:hypothetical protein
MAQPKIQPLDQRKEERKKLDVVLCVTDLHTGREVGCLVDISPVGMMLVSQTPIPVNTVYQFSISLPMPINGEDSISFGAESLWNNMEEDSGHCWSGFQVIDISEAHQKVIELLIEKL